MSELALKLIEECKRTKAKKLGRLSVEYSFALVGLLLGSVDGSLKHSFRF